MRPSSHSSSSMLLLVLLLQIGSSFAQSSRIFQWKFSSQNGQSLSTCQDLPILVQPFDTTSASSTGVAPYYMMALALGATSRLYPIGSDPAKLSWKVDFPPSTQLFLSVIDSNNTSGGIAASVYTVVAGQSTTCVKNDDANPSFKLSSNVTDEIQTCAPWGLTVQGGTPPYTWTLAQLGSPVITNVTGLSTDNEYVYINRGTPGARFLAAASDSTGRFASGTPVVMPKGSTDVECDGAQSVLRTAKSSENNPSSSSSAPSPSQTSSNPSPSQSSGESKSNAGLIAGVVIGVIAFLFICTAGFLWRRKQRQQSTNGKPNSLNFIPSRFINNRNNGVEPFPQSLSSPTNNNTTSSSQPFPSKASRYQEYDSRISYENQPVGSGALSSSQYAGDVEAQPVSRNMTQSSHARSASGSRGDLYSNSSAAPSRSAQGAPSQVPEGNEIIIQHRDGGIVRELPPPYANHGDSNQRGNGY